MTQINNNTHTPELPDKLNNTRTSQNTGRQIIAHSNQNGQENKKQQQCPESKQQLGGQTSPSKGSHENCPTQDKKYSSRCQCREEPDCNCRNGSDA